MLVASILAVAATVMGFVVAKPGAFDIEPLAPAAGDGFHPEPVRASVNDSHPAPEPLGVKRFQGTLQASIGSPTGHVILGPTTDNDAKFEAGPKGSYAVTEVAWKSDDIHDLGAVLFRLHSDLGYVGEATSLDWEYITDVTGPSPLHLATPIEPDARYIWSVYPLPRQVIVRLDFESAMSVFETAPPADYRVFPAAG